MSWLLKIMIVLFPRANCVWVSQCKLSLSSRSHPPLPEIFG